jgi:hypothetical protein
MTEPQQPTTALWLLPVLLVVLFVVARFGERWDPLLLCLVGAVIAAQGADGLRWNRFRARFPRGGSIDVARFDSPFSFWCYTAVALALGLTLAGAGIWLLVQ